MVLGATDDGCGSSFYCCAVLCSAAGQRSCVQFVVTWVLSFVAVPDSDSGYSYPTWYICKPVNLNFV